jgi:hypothetical protein
MASQARCTVRAPVRILRQRGVGRVQAAVLPLPLQPVPPPRPGRPVSLLARLWAWIRYRNRARPLRSSGARGPSPKTLPWRQGRGCDVGNVRLSSVVPRRQTGCLQDTPSPPQKKGLRNSAVSGKLRLSRTTVCPDYSGSCGAVGFSTSCDPRESDPHHAGARRYGAARDRCKFLERCRLRRIRAVLYPERRAVIIRAPRAFLPLVSHWPWASCQPAEALLLAASGRM